MLCGGRAHTIWTSLPPFGSAPRPFFVALCLPPAALLPAYRGLLFWILVTFLSCPPVRFCLLLVVAARYCIIDRNSESSSGSSPLPPPCVPAREIVAQSDVVASGLSTANSQEGGKSKMGRR